MLPEFQGLSRVGDWLLRLPYWAFSLTMVVGVGLQVGIRWPWQPTAKYLEYAADWPTGYHWDSSPAWLLVPTRLGFVGTWAWDALWLGLLAVCTIAVLVRAKGLLHDPAARVYLLGVAASAIPVQLLWSLGDYDEIFLLGILLIATLGRVGWIVGLAMAATANAEMGVTAGLAALALSLGLRRRDGVQRALSLIAASAVVSLSVFLAQRLDPSATEPSRLAQFAENAVQSVKGNLPWLPLTVASMFLGAWLIVVLVCFLPIGRRDRWLVVAGLLLIPMALAIVTLDGSRVAVGVSSLAFLIALRVWSERISGPEGLGLAPASFRLAVAVIAVLAVATPAVSVFVDSPASDWVGPWRDLIGLASAR